MAGRLDSFIEGAKTAAIVTLGLIVGGIAVVAVGLWTMALFILGIAAPVLIRCAPIIAAGAVILACIWAWRNF